MQNALLVSRFQSIGNFDEDLDQAAGLDVIVAFDDSGQTVAGKKVHDDVRLPIVDVAVVNGNYIGMVNASDSLGFSLKAGHTVLIAEKLGLQHFDGDGAVDHVVLAPVDNAHATASDFCFDEVFIGERLTNERLFYWNEQAVVVNAHDNRADKFPRTKRASLFDTSRRFCAHPTSLIQKTDTSSNTIYLCHTKT